MTEPLLPDGTVDLRSEVVPAVRALLARGLDEELQRTCVRIGGFTRFGGGLKADLVGGLRIDVAAVLKLGDAELAQHERFIDRVNRTRNNTFPRVLLLRKLDGARWLMFMEELLGHTTLSSLTYERPTRRADLERIVEHVFDRVRAIRRTRLRLPRLVDPYTERLRDRFRGIVDADPALAVIRKKRGVVLGVPTPPLDVLLDDVARWAPDVLAKAPRTLCHGDLHLGNIMARRRGNGWSVRLIDPNPTIGISDPLYDAGKLLHFAEPVGWAYLFPDRCKSRLGRTRSGYTLDASVDAPASAEVRRGWLEAILRERLAVRRAADPTRAARLFLATAAAHVGLAAFLHRTEHTPARRLTVAYALAALARWHAAR
jgi:hypothetical protein